MGAHQDGTRAQSASGLKDKVSATDTRKERPLEGGSRPKGAKEAASLMEECLLAPHCGMRHRPAACDKFNPLPDGPLAPPLTDGPRSDWT
jgi:hypothetical protein